MAQPISSVMIHMHKSGRSSAHSRENNRYFAEKFHICWESSWNGWKTAGTRIKASNQQQAISSKQAAATSLCPLNE